jgi:hypothetical protein
MLKTVTEAVPPMRFAAGQVYDVNPVVASAWEKAGLCERDKMADVPEFKVPPEIAGEVVEDKCGGRPSRPKERSKFARRSSPL